MHSYYFVSVLLLDYPQDYFPGHSSSLECPLQEFLVTITRFWKLLQPFLDH